MATGRFHGMVSMAAGIIAGGTVYYATRDVAAAAALGGACLAGVIISPDLDEPNPTHSHTEVRHGFGMIIALLWWIFWQPYALIVTRHRSLLSHFPILSTAGRVGYLGTILLPTLWILKYLRGLTPVIRGIETKECVGVLIQPIWERIQPLLNHPFPLPGVDLWVVFLVIAAILTGLSILKVDLAQNNQKELFWVISGVSTVIITVWMLVRLAYGTAFLIQIPIGGWLFMGLCLSDTLHALVDWYVPIWI